jgi:hypothetical protein
MQLEEPAMLTAVRDMLRRWFSPPPTPASPARPNLERLEDRFVPTNQPLILNFATALIDGGLTGIGDPQTMAFYRQLQAVEQVGIFSTIPVVPINTNNPIERPELGTPVFLEPGAPSIKIRTHIPLPVDYDALGFTNPPAYGPHFPEPLPAGIYSAQQPDQFIVHTMEHGDVWISYNPDLLPPDQVQQLQMLVAQFGPLGGIVLEPRIENTHAIELVSWGHLLSQDAFDPATVGLFIVLNRGSAPEGFSPSGLHTGGM